MIRYCVQFTCGVSRLHLIAGVTTCALALAWPTAAAANSLLNAALASVTSDELHQHVEILADDIYEGRGAGSRGGYAAGQYLVQQLREVSLEPAGTDGDYFQSLQNGGRNILAMLPGTDPRLAEEVIIVGAHYDHVGRGTKGTSLGQVGEIHNGADDNASGVAVLLETIEAMATMGLSGRRSILFAFWDSEETGLVGSKYWTAHSTLPDKKIKLAIHADMVGRLRGGRLQVLGTRSGYGMRQLMSGPVNDPLWLDFSWAISANSDHWSFLEHEVPIALLHTGVHEDYHRPTDDVERIDATGMQEIGRYLLAVLVKAANVDQLPPFRAAVVHENSVSQRQAESPLPSLGPDAWPAHLPPPRLGISWRGDEAEPGTVCLTRVVAGTPAAAAGLEVLDRIGAVNGQPFADEDSFRAAILELIDTGTSRFTLLVETRGRLRTLIINLPASEATLQSRKISRDGNPNMGTPSTGGKPRI